MDTSPALPDVLPVFTCVLLPSYQTVCSIHTHVHLPARVFRGIGRISKGEFFAFNIC